jgi:penicillin-binding protein 1A
MQNVLKDEPVRVFEVPEGVTFIKMYSGEVYLPSGLGEKIFFECFKEGTAPLPFSREVAEP